MALMLSGKPFGTDLKTQSRCLVSKLNTDFSAALHAGSMGQSIVLFQAMGRNTPACNGDYCCFLGKQHSLTSKTQCRGHACSLCVLFSLHDNGKMSLLTGSKTPKRMCCAAEFWQHCKAESLWFADLVKNLGWCLSCS